MKLDTNHVLPLPKTLLEPRKVTYVWADPQAIYKVKRLVPHKRHPGIDLQDLRVGNNCQTVAAGSVPLDVFMPDERLEAITRELLEAKIKGLDAAAMTALLDGVRDVANNLGAVNTATVGQRVGITLFNHGAEPVLFEGHLLGFAVTGADEPRPRSVFRTSEVDL